MTKSQLHAVIICLLADKLCVLLCVDWSLSELESSRNDLLYELQKQPHQTPTDRDVCIVCFHLYYCAIFTCSTVLFLPVSLCVVWSGSCSWMSQGLCPWSRMLYYWSVCHVCGWSAQNSCRQNCYHVLHLYVAFILRCLSVFSVFNTDTTERFRFGLVRFNVPLDT